MAISTDLERLGYGSPSGCIATGQHKQVISGVGATRTLLPEESGALCLFDRAAGVVYTLPTPVEGMKFEFATTVTVTSNAAKTVTGTPASQFILGTMFGYTTDATEIDGFSADGSTHVAISSNGSTTGGVIGDRYTLTAISATQWLVEGNIFCGTSTPATPFATS
jgi:hypothetical protein